MLSPSFYNDRIRRITGYCNRAFKQSFDLAPDCEWSKEYLAQLAGPAPEGYPEGWTLQDARDHWHDKGDRALECIAKLKRRKGACRSIARSRGAVRDQLVICREIAMCESFIASFTRAGGMARRDVRRLRHELKSRKVDVTSAAWQLQKRKADLELLQVELGSVMLQEVMFTSAN